MRLRREDFEMLLESEGNGDKDLKRSLKGFRVGFDGIKEIILLWEKEFCFVQLKRLLR